MGSYLSRLERIPDKDEVPGSTSDKSAIVETEAELGVVLAARCECCTKKRKTQKF